jgi:ribosomal protein S18 acetylase RimI-like enzyme
MLQVKTMSEEDFEFAVSITDLMDWDFTEADFDFMAGLEPEGCFVLFRGAERIGVATTVSYGQVGWFGNLIVAPDARHSGGGTLLVKHAVKYLVDKGVTTVGLYAYLDRISFYTTLGFAYDSDFTVLKGKARSSPADVPDVRKAEKHDVDEVIRLDRACFGGSRRKLLEPLLLNPESLCHVYVENGRLAGFAVAKVYHGAAEVGPIVCRRGRRDGATGLVTTTLNRLEGLEVSLCIPEKKAALVRFLRTLGFAERFRVARMFFGPAVLGDCVWAAESLERG